MTLPAVDASTNKFSNTTDYEFDAVGNLIRDIHGRQFTFNGDNKQVEVRNSANQVVGEYKYDGLGKRIKKDTATEYVVFVYDGLGKLIGEYSADGPPAAPTVNYTATDPLGSPRVLTNKQGEVVSRRDFMPFGEEIVAMAETHRTPGDKYGVGDNVRQKFTGYERDEETGLDFAEARYYYNNHGRFTAVDPLLASGKSADPQTFNRYAYTMNRPLILTDPTGLQAGAQKPPTSDEIDLEGTRRDPGREGYQLVIVGSTSIAINNGVVTDEDGNVIKDHGLKDVTEKTNGFGIIVRYALSSGSFPAPDKDAKTTFEEVISNSTLNGERNTRGDVAEAPVEGKLVDGQIQFNDWVGTRSDQPGGPASVSEGDQTIKIRTTINGNREEPFVVRTNRIVINPRDKVKIKILDTTPKEQDEFEPLD